MHYYCRFTNSCHANYFLRTIDVPLSKNIFEITLRKCCHWQNLILKSSNNILDYYFLNWKIWNNQDHFVEIRFRGFCQMFVMFSVNYTRHFWKLYLSTNYIKFAKLITEYSNNCSMFFAPKNINRHKKKLNC